VVPGQSISEGYATQNGEDWLWVETQKVAFIMPWKFTTCGVISEKSGS
jgi:hypothetical protein